MRYRHLVILACVVVGMPPGAVGADRKPPSSGAEMYKAYCASCHGLKGKGDGPAAKALKASVPDLTLLSKRNGGAFPAVRVFQAIEGSVEVAAHGSKQMPVWGPVFTSLGGASAAEVKLRVRNLTRYVESLQAR